jgi:hypothetical protein
VVEHELKKPLLHRAGARPEFGMPVALQIRYATSRPTSPPL